MLSTSLTPMPITIMTLIMTHNHSIYMSYRCTNMEVFTACVQARDKYNTSHLLHYPPSNLSLSSNSSTIASIIFTVANHLFSRQQLAMHNSPATCVWAPTAAVATKANSFIKDVFLPTKYNVTINSWQLNLTNGCQQTAYNRPKTRLLEWSSHCKIRWLKSFPSPLSTTLLYTSAPGWHVARLCRDGALENLRSITLQVTLGLLYSLLCHTRRSKLLAQSLTNMIRSVFILAFIDCISRPLD